MRVVFSLSAPSVPVYESHPGAPVSLYLDFDGHYQDEFYGCDDWGCGDTWDWLLDTMYEHVNTPVFDWDGDSSSFSRAERNAIQTIWQIVAEDFAPFDINVTTDWNSVFDTRALRVAIGGSSSDWLGTPAGGVSYQYAFRDDVPDIAYAFARSPAGANYSARFIADTVSHEAGHTFGLAHQSAYDRYGNMTQQYSDNGGSSLKAPIMGASANAARGLWWYSYNPAAEMIQDDMAVIAKRENGFGYRTDDHGNTAGTATWLSSPTVNPTATGIIHQTSDVDYFAFQVSVAGEVTASVDVAAVGPNLDASLEIRNASGGAVLGSAATASLGESITIHLEPGEYRLAVRSAGRYGDVGQYTVRLSLPSGLEIEGRELVDDVVTIDQRAGQWQVTVNGTTKSYPVSLVSGIRVNTYGGNDTVSVLDSVVGVPVEINTGSGNDTIHVGRGLLDDILGDVQVNGGVGNDLLSVSDRDHAVSAEYTLDRTSVRRDQGGQIVYDSIESLALTAGRSRDTVRVVRWSAADVDVDGGAGVDTLVGSDRTNQWTIRGLNYGVLNADMGFTGFENLTGGSGDDTFVFDQWMPNLGPIAHLKPISGRLDGTVDGGAGRDTLDYSPWTGAVTVDLSLGTASAVAAVRNMEDVAGGRGNDEIRGNWAANLLRGGAGDDLLDGHGGNDILLGDGGEDTLYGRAGRDLLVGGLDEDSLDGGSNSDILVGGWTDYDGDNRDLFNIAFVWGRDVSLAERTAALASGRGWTGPQLNDQTVHDDAVRDQLFLDGILIEDWIFTGNLDREIRESPQFVLPGSNVFGPTI